MRVEFESSSGLETRFVPLTAAHRSPRVTRALGRPPSATQPQPQPPRCTQTGILSQGTGAVLEFVRSYRPADIASGSQLAASFSVVLPKTIQELAAGPFPIILAVGPLAADGSLLPHAGSTSRFPYGGAELTLPGASAG